jgi:NAD(P)-dependent dehydrogenase (short-subunit alcohol dehydrogenase family)
MPADTRPLSGKTALITGAGGAIGAAIARRLHAQGARVVGVDISEDGFEELRRAIPDVETVVADVSTPQGADLSVAAGRGTIDILCNNAGIHDGGGAIDELDDATWERVIAVNLTAAFLLARRVVQGMLTAKAGVIVNMSSVAGLRGGRTGVAYTASKWALVGMAQNIASSLGAEGIRAYAICPGVVSGETKLAAVTATPRSIKSRGRDQGQPPPTTPEDVANVLAFLVSEHSRHLNGIAVPIDSGWLAY